MAPFPSHDELIVASALLLLSTSEPNFKTSGFESTKFRKKARETSLSSKLEAKSFMSGESSVIIRGEEEEEIESSKPKAKYKSSSSSSSSLYSASSEIVNCSSSSSEFNADNKKLRIVSVVTCRSREMMFKVVKKCRTKVSWISDHRKTFTSQNAPWKKASSSSDSESTEVSCLSYSSSTMENRLVTSCGKRKTVSSFPDYTSRSSTSQMKRRAESILGLLSNGCFSEVKIRKVLGDSPDTSKALRM
ncbi:hypothetical protein ACFE04_001144 [Oxalis oulophora]